MKFKCLQTALSHFLFKNIVLSRVNGIAFAIFAMCTEEKVVTFLQIVL